MNVKAEHNLRGMDLFINTKKLKCCSESAPCGLGCNFNTTAMKNLPHNFSTSSKCFIIYKRSKWNKRIFML